MRGTCGILDRFSDRQQPTRFGFWTVFGLYCSALNFYFYCSVRLSFAPRPSPSTTSVSVDSILPRTSLRPVPFTSLVFYPPHTTATPRRSARLTHGSILLGLCAPDRSECGHRIASPPLTSGVQCNRSASYQCSSNTNTPHTHPGDQHKRTMESQQFVSIAYFAMALDLLALTGCAAFCESCKMHRTNAPQAKKKRIK